MEKPVDPNRPSDDSVVRNPFYRRRHPVPSTECNQMSVYAIDESVCPETASLGAERILETYLKVFLRVMPLPGTMELSEEQRVSYDIVNPTTLLTRIPHLDAETVNKEFTFTEIFGPRTFQLSLFEKIIQPQLVKFLGGESGIVMTYGTRNSGKSHTLEGCTSSPGIIPRSLAYIFQIANPKLLPSFKPLRYSNVLGLSQKGCMREIKKNRNILASLGAAEIPYILQAPFPSTPVAQAVQYNCLVWVSFALIYHRNIYDALQDGEKENKNLHTSMDRKGRPFIDGQRAIWVASPCEAYQVYMAGRKKCQARAYEVQKQSHYFFTVMLIKITNENGPKVTMNRFSFCELSGDGHMENARDDINLASLNRCLKAIYQDEKMAKVHYTLGPFQGSPLTRLCQHALSGHEHMALITTINPLLHLQKETQKVLNCTAIETKTSICPEISSLSAESTQENLEREMEKLEISEETKKGSFSPETENWMRRVRELRQQINLRIRKDEEQKDSVDKKDEI